MAVTIAAADNLALAEVDLWGNPTPRSFAVAASFSEEDIVEAAFRHYRQIGYPYRRLPLWKAMLEINKLAATPTDSLLHSVAAYQVADTYHPHRFHASAEGMRAPFDSYCDDKALRKAVRLAVQNSKDVETVLWIVNGTQACANFRPGFACYLYRRFCKPGFTVLDTGLFDYQRDIAASGDPQAEVRRVRRLRARQDADPDRVRPHAADADAPAAGAC
jgi:hypothetical protein